MKLALITAASVSFGLCSSVLAQDAPIMRAQVLGKLLAAEKFCGLVYDEGKVADYLYSQMQEEVEFASWVDTVKSSEEQQQGSYSAPLKTAFCRQMIDMANKIGIVR